jgi:ankyrin repeat protein
MLILCRVKIVRKFWYHEIDDVKNGFKKIVGLLRQKTDVVRLLVERWPEGTREKDNYGNTPLHLAAEAGKTRALEDKKNES